MNRSLICRKLKCFRSDVYYWRQSYLIRRSRSTAIQDDHRLNTSQSQTSHFYLHSLNVKNEFNPIKKFESFVKKSFFGEYDKDYLIFPNLFGSESDLNHLSEQYDNIRENFMELSADPKNIIKYGFYDVDSMTTFELVHLFEAIGASLNYQTHTRSTVNICETANSTNNKLMPIGKNLIVTDSFLIGYQKKKSFIQRVLPLVVYNSLIMSAIDGCDNPVIKKKFKSENCSIKPTVGFAYCELDDKFAALPYPYWDSYATLHEDKNMWTVNGTKCRIIKSDYDYEKYLIFCKTPKVQSNREDNKNSHTFDIVSFLVDRDLLQIENDGSDNYGNRYLRISFKDLLLSREEHELFCEKTTEHPYAEPAFSLNVKARGQLAVSSIILGMMKQSMKNIFQTNHASGSLLNEQICRATELLFGLESMVYLTASHFDTVDNTCGDLFLQTMIVKTLSTQFSTELLDIFRFLFGARHLSSLVSTQTNNVISSLDAFLDSAVANRMLLAAYGMKSIGEWKFDFIAKTRLRSIYFKHFLKFEAFSKFREQELQRFLNLKDDYTALSKLQPGLENSTKLLKEVLNNQKEMGNHILTIYGKECINNQIDMNRYASIAMASFHMISVIARTNWSLQRQTPQSQLELKLCNSICKREAKQVSFLRRLIENVLDTSEEKRSKAIHKRNMRFDGYFAKSTFDRII